MKPSILSKQFKLTNGIIAAILLWVPFAAFITVWASSLTGHYTLWRLLEDGVAVAGLLLLIPALGFRNKAWGLLKRQHIFWLIVGYIVLEVVIGLVSLAKKDVNTKALGYALIVDLRFPLFFIFCLVAASRSSWLRRHWQPLVLVPATAVVAFGLLQYLVLPYNFLQHFGYSAQTIFPYETINHNIHYLRVASTLRGANPLGAYLIVIVSLTTALLLKAKNQNKKLVYALLLATSLATLIVSFSRSAWIGAALSLAIVLYLSIKDKRMRRWLAALAVIIVILGGAAFLILRNNTSFQNTIFHTSKNSSITASSDQGHLSALKSGIHDVLHQPLGGGPGTSGPASIYNLAPPVQPENYFVQIGQEVGWLGIVLFVLINYLVSKGLWLFKEEPLALGLLAALIGITLVNMFLPAWTDNTLSYLWWGLAGIALSPVLKSKLTKQSERTESGR